MGFFQYGILLFPIAILAGIILPMEEAVLYIGGIVVIIHMVLFFYGTRNAYSPVIKELEITMPKKEATVDQLHIVAASDFHLGLLSNKRHLERFVDLSNKLQPDVVFLGGDIVDDDPIWYSAKGMSHTMAQLKTNYGVYGVLGNHEYYGKKIPEMVKEMEISGVKMLLDETIKIADAFYLTGREDLTNKGRKTLHELKEEVDDSLPWFVIDHTPSDLKLPSELGVDFHFSGHTHLGQLWPNHIFTRKLFELDHGYLQKGGLHAVVSSGFGFWGPPVRIGSRSEIWSIRVIFK